MCKALKRFRGSRLPTKAEAVATYKTSKLEHMNRLGIPCGIHPATGGVAPQWQIDQWKKGN